MTMLPSGEPRLVVCLLAAMWLTPAVAAERSESHLVRPGPNDKLVYAADAAGNLIPDFSWCGYGGGGVPLPNVPVKRRFEPTGGDDTAAIQDAIDAVGALPMTVSGFRGAVLLATGTYRIAGTLRLRQSGVVLRGSGAGTVLLATGTTQRTLVAISGSGADTIAGGSRVAITSRFVPLGARTFEVSSASGFAAGDPIRITRPSTEEWIHAIGMDRLQKAWEPGSKDLHFSRTILAIDGRRITIDAPLGNSLDAEWGGGFVTRVERHGRVTRCAVENLTGDSEYTSATDENHGWVFVQLGNAEHCWVSDVTATHFGYSCVSVSGGAMHCTVQDCACLDPISQITGGRRYSFGIAGQLNLVQRCRARHGRHDFVIGACVPGPNVFLDCKAEKAHSDTGPHHRWACGTLFDNVAVSGNAINVRNRGNSGSGHGWAGAFTVLWNCHADSMIVAKPPTANNYAFGCVTQKRGGDGHWESFNTTISPRSLYVAQLQQRLGPAAVANIAKDARRPTPNMTPVKKASRP